MARTTGAKCRLCRLEGIKLFLKGPRCETVKCAIHKRSVRPGMHGRRRRKQTGFAIHLREKQKLKRIYGLLDRQFLRYFRQAQRMPGNTGENLLLLLETRLDNLVYKLGFALSRAQARQLIAHGHFQVNGRKVDIPSALVSRGDLIAPRPREATQKVIRDNLELNVSHEVPSWLERSSETLEGRVLQLPTRQDISLPVQELLVVEFCSR